MRRNGIYQYYVEGDNEKKLINTLKQELKCIQAGKVDIFNPVQERFNNTRLIPLRTGTMVVLVYDTDTDSVGILKDNIYFLKKQSVIKDVICIPQVRRLEDELVRACNIKNVLELTKSSSEKDFKRDFNKCTNLDDILKNADFDMGKMWNQMPQNDFVAFGNDSQRIKLIS